MLIIYTYPTELMIIVTLYGKYGVEVMITIYTLDVSDLLLFPSRYRFQYETTTYTFCIGR